MAEKCAFLAFLCSCSHFFVTGRLVFKETAAFYITTWSVEDAKYNQMPDGNNSCRDFFVH